MKWPQAALIGGAIAAVGALGARYFGAPFKIYLLVFLLIAFLVASYLVRREERGLAEDLGRLDSGDREDILSELDPGSRERVRRDIERKP